jgi:large subunit ribosomal protein L20
MRVKRGVTTKKKHKKVLKQTKGMQRAPRKSVKLGKQAVVRSLQYSYRDRRNRKRDMRQLWITRINAAARLNGTTYSRLTAAMKAKNVDLDRKTMSELAVNEPEAFASVVKFVSK